MTPLTPTPPSATAPVGTDGPGDLLAPGAPQGVDGAGSFQQTLLETLGEPASTLQNENQTGTQVPSNAPIDPPVTVAGEGGTPGAPDAVGPDDDPVALTGAPSGGRKQPSSTANKTSTANNAGTAGSTGATSGPAPNRGGGTTRSPNDQAAGLPTICGVGVTLGPLGSQVVAADTFASSTRRAAGGVTDRSSVPPGSSLGGVATDNGAYTTDNSAPTRSVDRGGPDSSLGSASVASKVTQGATSSFVTTAATGRADGRAQDRPSADSGGARAAPATTPAPDGQLAAVPTGGESPISVAGSSLHAGVSEGNSTFETSMPGVASQLVSVISPLRVSSDGTRSLTVALHPGDLGDVRVTVTTTDQGVVVRMSAASDAGHDALRQNLPQLQQQLTSHGQRATVVLADAGSGDAHRQSGQLESPDSSKFSDGSLDADVSGPDIAPQGSGQPGRGDPAGTRLLDLRL